MPTILLIEADSPDHPPMRSAFAAAFRGCELVIVDSGAKAWAFVNADAVRPALILLDVILPDMSGMELLQRLKTKDRLSTVPVVMLSGASGPTVTDPGYATLANASVQKPEDPEQMQELARAIKSLWLDMAPPLSD